MVFLLKKKGIAILDPNRRKLLYRAGWRVASHAAARCHSIQLISVKL
jgi:hypothetical protein